MKARLLRNMLADEARAKSEETRSLCGWDPRDDDDDTISRVSVYATLPRKSKWGSLKSLFSRKSDASIDLGPDDIANGDGEEEDDDGFSLKKLGKKGFRRAKSTTSISSCPPEVGTTTPRKQKSYRRSKSNTVARPLGVWQEEANEVEDKEEEQETLKSEPRKIKSYLRDESSLRIKPEKRTSIFSPRSTISSMFTKKEDDIGRPARPLVLPVGDDNRKTLTRDYDSHRYRSLAIEDEVLKPKNRFSLDFGKNSKTDRIYQNGSTNLSNYTQKSTPTSKDSDRSWRNTSLTEKFPLRRKKIQSDDVYVRKMREILNAYPCRGPPYNMTMLSYNMYMGSQKNADDIGMLRRFGITHVLNMAGTRKMNFIENPYKPNSGVLHYLMIPAQDYEDYDIAANLPEALAFLDHAKRTGGKALVHCNMGVNRSGAVCAAYLMTDQKMNLIEMTKYIKLKRNFALVNRGFQKQIVKFAREKNMLEPL